MDKDFEKIFSKVSANKVLSYLIGNPIQGIDLKEIAHTSMAIIDFDTDDRDLITNSAFIKSWGIARTKAEENLKLIAAIILLKKKYKVSDFDFELILENFDEDHIF